MRSRFYALARVSGAVLTAAAAGGTVYAAAQQQKDFSGQAYLRSTTLIPTAHAEASASEQTTGGFRGKVCVERKLRHSTIALSGFEAVGDPKSFLETVLAKALRQRDSSLRPLAAAESGPASFGEQQPPVSPASFYSFYEKQPLSEKVSILDDTIEAVVREAERSAEVEGLSVGLLGGGVACYALAGWWADMALPGLGTVGCTVAAGVSGHNLAKKASRRTRSRLLNAVTASREAGAPPNAFIDYLSAASTDAKQRIASSTKPDAFFNDFYSAVKPILKQVSAEGEGGAAALGVLDVAA